MNLTIAELAAGLARLDGRLFANTEDYALAVLIHPYITATRPTPRDVAVAHELLRGAA